MFSFLFASQIYRGQMIDLSIWSGLYMGQWCAKMIYQWKPKKNTKKGRANVACTRHTNYPLSLILIYANSEDLMHVRIHNATQVLLWFSQLIQVLYSPYPSLEYRTININSLSFVCISWTNLSDSNQFHIDIWLQYNSSHFGDIISGVFRWFFYFSLIFRYTYANTTSRFSWLMLKFKWCIIIHFIMRIIDAFK